MVTHKVIRSASPLNTIEKLGGGFKGCPSRAEADRSRQVSDNSVLCVPNILPQACKLRILPNAVSGELRVK